MYIQTVPSRFRGRAGVPVLLSLLLDIPKLDVMELPRMFAQSTYVRPAGRVRAEIFPTGFLPLDPEAHILAARMAGAGTHR